MIDVFGTSGMPIRINDAVIISSTRAPISAGTVYIFHSIPLERLYKFGEQNASELWETYENIIGYLSCNGCPEFQGESFCIISKSNPHVLFRLESVRANRTRNTIKANGRYTTAVKFLAMRLHDLCR
jgi:hypothetical protein